jgi:hypothetical protein
MVEEVSMLNTVPGARHLQVAPNGVIGQGVMRVS